MLDVHAPSHISRKSRYSNARKTRLNKQGLSTKASFDQPVRSQLRQLPLALDQMNEIAVTILEEHEPVTLIFVRRANKFDVLGLEIQASAVEIIYRDSDVSDTRCAHLRF